MHFSAAILTTAIFSASTCYAWTYSNGVWVANNNWYPLAGGFAHESCTYQGTQNIHKAGDPCAYFIDGNGHIYHGHCVVSNGNFLECGLQRC